ncbi:MAG: hypothetical protein ACE5MK_07500 [Acidobacteriota bacterium]
MISKAEHAPQSEAARREPGLRVRGGSAGVQYLWNAGYDPKGFVTFFDKMASEKGYVRSASFFRTHPPFFERMVSTFSEIEYLPPKDELRVDSTEFQQAQNRLREVIKESNQKRREENRRRPTLKRKLQCVE